MPEENHLKLLRQGVDVWNAWREKEPGPPDLGRMRQVTSHFSMKVFWPDLADADLTDADLSRADLTFANLAGANLQGANLVGANLKGANLFGARLAFVKLSNANLSEAYLKDQIFTHKKLDGVNLSRADLSNAFLNDADLTEANLSHADLRGANLSGANLSRANLSRAKLVGADLGWANLSKAKLCGADLTYADLVEADFRDADITGCSVYGVSAWGLKLSAGTKQQNLLFTPSSEAAVTVDNIEIAQFIYLLLHNEKIGEAIDTIGKKGVLLLGRFTGGRIEVLARLREELRKRGLLPIVFDFKKPKTKTFTETVRLLAGLSHFVIVDITDPKSVPLELQAAVPLCMVPFFPILDGTKKGRKPFSMFKDLKIAHPDRVSQVIRYSSVDRLIDALDAKIIAPAQERFADLVTRKAEQGGYTDV